MDLVLAGRLSQKATGQTGLDTQDEDSRSWAIGQGHTIVATAADHISGRVLPQKRRQLGPWMNDPVLMAMHDGILASKIDRLTRIRDWDIRTWAERNGKKIVIVQPELVWPPEPGDLATPIIWDNLVNIAVSEWENASIRYRRMHKALHDQAFFVGKPPYGYEIVRVDGTEHKTLKPHPITAAVVQTIFQLYLSGEWSIRRIAEWLNEKGIQEPQPSSDRKRAGWNDNGVRRILRKPSAIGRIVWNGHTVLRVDPLVSAADYKQVQEMIDRRATRSAVTRETAMMTGMLFCENDHPMYRLQGRKIPSVPDGQYYYCRECPKGQRFLISMASVHQYVDNRMTALTDTPNIVTVVTPGDDYANEIDKVRRDISEVDPESDDYDIKVPKLREELKRLRDLAKKSKPKVTQKIDDKSRSIAEAWGSLTTATDRRKFLMGKEAVIRAEREPDGSTILTGPSITFRPMASAAV